jgi:hypothetical protein
MVTPEGQVAGPLRLVRRVLHVKPTRDRFAGGLVRDGDFDSAGPAPLGDKQQMAQRYHKGGRMEEAEHGTGLYSIHTGWFHQSASFTQRRAWIFLVTNRCASVNEDPDTSTSREGA